MIPLKEFQEGADGLSDLIAYKSIVDEGVILTHDASYITAFYFRGFDHDSSTSESLRILSARANAALLRLGTGWVINVDSVRVPAVEYPDESRCAFTDPCTRAIDAERRQQYQQEGAHYETRFAMTLTWLMPKEFGSKVEKIFIDDGNGKLSRRPRGNAELYWQHLARFKQKVREITDAFSASLQLRQMNSAELLTFLHSCISGRSHPIRVPAPAQYLDAVFGCADFAAGLRPRIGKKWIRTISINGFPGESMPGMLDALNRLPFEFRWSTRFIPLDKRDAEVVLSKIRKNWWQGRHGIFSFAKEIMGAGGQTWVNADAVRMAEDADIAFTENSTQSVRFGYYTSVIVLMEEDTAVADQRVAEVTKFLNELGFSAFEEGMNANEAYLGSLPGHGWFNVRRPLMHSLNLADLLPLTAAWAGHASNPCPFYPPNSPPLFYAATNGSTPFRFSLHVGDLGHFGIFGPPGAGKSTLLDLLIAQHMRYPKAQAFCFDLGYSMYTLCEAAGGAHYDIGADPEEGLESVGFCPLAEIDSPQERSWAVDYIELLISLRLGPNEKLSVEERNEIRHAIDNLQASSSLSSQRSITNLMGTINSHKLKEALEHYTVGAGALGDLIDAKHDALSGTGGQRFFVFEIGNLERLGKEAVIAVMTYIFHQIEKRVSRSIPTIIPIDEAFRSFSHPLALERLVRWLEVMRKENAAVGLATQNLDTVLRSEVGTSILQTIATTILLPNEAATQPQIMEIYKKIGLNEREIYNIAEARPKRDYYVICGADGRRKIDLGLGKIALAFLGASGVEQAKVVRRLKVQHGENWVLRWLEMRGVSPGWVEYYAKLMKEMR